MTNKIKGKTIVLDKPPHTSQKAENLQLKTTQVALDGPRRYRSSSRIDRLAKPLARLQKPLVRPSTTAIQGNLI